MPTNTPIPIANGTNVRASTVPPDIGILKEGVFFTSVVNFMMRYLPSASLQITLRLSEVSRCHSAASSVNSKGVNQRAEKGSQFFVIRDYDSEESMI